jgi:hypothetical protein
MTLRRGVDLGKSVNVTRKLDNIDTPTFALHANNNNAMRAMIVRAIVKV